MPTMTRESWTDERMDDLSKAVDTGFDRVDRRFEHVDRQFEQVHAEIGAVRADMKEMATRRELQAAVSGLRSEMKIRFDEVDKQLNKFEDRFASFTLRFDQLEQNLLRIGCGLVGALVVGLLGVIATQV